GGDRLAVEIDYRPMTARRVAEIPGVELWQDGDHEKTFLFHIDLFPAVAAIVRPRKRRRRALPPEQLKAGGERLARLRAVSRGSGQGEAAKDGATAVPEQPSVGASGN